MTYEQLIDRAAAYGKSERDVLWRMALTSAMCLRDMTDEDIAEMIVDGDLDMTPARAKEIWEEYDPQMQALELQSMVIAWTT